MKVWRIRLRRQARAGTVTPTVDRVASATQDDGQEQRQAVSPEQFDRSPVYVLFRA